MDAATGQPAAGQARPRPPLCAEQRGRAADVSDCGHQQPQSDAIRERLAEKDERRSACRQADVVTLGALLGDRRPGLSPDPGTTDVLYPNTPASQNDRAA